MLRIFKSLIRPIMDYADIIYEEANNKLLKNKIESIQDKACIAITGAI